MQATAAAQINASVLTAGDYTVYVTGIALEASNAEIVEFASHYGEVRCASHVVLIHAHHCLMLDHQALVVCKFGI